MLVIIVPEPAPDTVKTPFAQLAAPATPTEPISPSDQTEGSVGSTRTVREMVVVLVSVPEVPVTVTVTVPVVAVPLAVSVKVLVPVVLAGLKEGVTPLGRPDADNATLPLKPLSGFTVIALEPLDPCVMVRLLGEAERVKLGGGLTVRESVVELERLPEEPVMVTVAVPVVAVLLAVSVSVVVPVALAGLNEAVTPEGKPEASKLTVPLKPLSALMVTVVVPLAPWTMVRLLGEEASVKFP